MAERSGIATWGRVALLAAVLGTALAVLPGAQGTPSATCARDEPGQVRISARSLQPATIRVGPGTSVTWIACGAGTRRVASSTGAWVTFTLTPGRQRRVVFPRAGRYPYMVDGRTSGLVIVSVVGTAAPPPGQRQSERTLRYDIRVAASYRYRQTLDGGLVDTSMSYVGLWSNVPVKIYDAFGIFNAVGRGERGRIDAKLSYSDERGTTRCQGTVDYPPYLARAALTAGRVKGQEPYVNFQSHLAESRAFDDLTNARTTACDDLPASDGRTVWLGSFFSGTQGVRIDPPGAGVAETDARFSRNGGAGLPFPIDRVRDGKAFTIVGQRTVGPQPCGTGCSETSTGRVEFRFTPRR